MSGRGPNSKKSTQTKFKPIRGIIQDYNAQSEKLKQEQEAKKFHSKPISNRKAVIPRQDKTLNDTVLKVRIKGKSPSHINATPPGQIIIATREESHSIVSNVPDEMTQSNLQNNSNTTKNLSVFNPMKAEEEPAIVIRNTNTNDNHQNPSVQENKEDPFFLAKNTAYELIDYVNNFETELKCFLDEIVPLIKKESQNDKKFCEELDEIIFPFLKLRVTANLSTFLPVTMKEKTSSDALLKELIEKLTLLSTTKVMEKNYYPVVTLLAIYYDRISNLCQYNKKYINICDKITKRKEEIEHFNKKFQLTEEKRTTDFGAFLSRFFIKPTSMFSRYPLLLSDLNKNLKKALEFEQEKSTITQGELQIIEEIDKKMKEMLSFYDNLKKIVENPTAFIQLKTLFLSPQEETVSVSKMQKLDNEFLVIQKLFSIRFNDNHSPRTNIISLSDRGKSYCNLLAITQQWTTSDNFINENTANNIKSITELDKKIESDFLEVDALVTFYQITRELFPGVQLSNAGEEEKFENALKVLKSLHVFLIEIKKIIENQGIINAFCNFFESNLLIVNPNFNQLQPHEATIELINKLFYLLFSYCKNLTDPYTSYRGRESRKKKIKFSRQWPNQYQKNLPSFDQVFGFFAVRTNTDESATVSTEPLETKFEQIFKNLFSIPTQFLKNINTIPEEVTSMRLQP